MAELVDATVSNTVGATHPGSSPGPGTEMENLRKEVLHFLFVCRAVILCTYLDMLLRIGRARRVVLADREEG